MSVSCVASDPNHAEILRSGPIAWNAWREKNPATIPNLVGIALKLNERQMGPINGGPINLKSAQLQDAFLRFATLSAADLEAADMSGADFVHARFDQANLSAANLSNALLDHADFTGANLTKVNLSGATLRFATLSAADLEAADMSGADLVHARFDQANLSAANLSRALLDHADFAGANLTKVNFSGASLHHAKNLTRAQLEETTRSDSTILPPYLQESVSWSVGGSQTETTALERRDLGPRARHMADVDVPRISASTRPAWIVGVFLIGGALVGTGFVWQHLNEAVPPSSGAQIGSRPSLPAPKLSLDTGALRLEPSGRTAVMQEKPAAERRLSDDVEVPSMPSAASTETTPEQRPAPVTDSATVPQESNTHAEMQESDGVKRSEEAFGPNEPAPEAPGEGYEPKTNQVSESSVLVSAVSPITTSRHGTVTTPDLPAEALEASGLGSADSPLSTSRHGTVPDLRNEASAPGPQLTPASDVSAEAPTLGTPEPAASSLSDALPPPDVTVPSPVEQKDLPEDSAATPPIPVRKPLIHLPSSIEQKNVQMVSPEDTAATPPMPIRKPKAVRR
jgi:hypothetical protein